MQEEMRQQKKILVVDDDHLMLFGLSKALRQKDLDVVTAASARQALLSMEDSTFHMCLLNLDLPDGNGFDLMHSIKKSQPDTIVTLMTSSYIEDEEMRENIKGATRTGECLFLVKPFDLSAATSLVLNTLDGKACSGEGFRLTDEGYLDKQRKSRRRPFVKILKCFTDSIKEGEVQRNPLRVVATDICEGGIGLLTQTPLKADQVISFDEDLYCRIGIVVWSTMLNDITCRAGVKFT